MSTDYVAMEVIKRKMLGKKLTSHEILGLMDAISHERLSKVQVAYYVAASFAGGFTDDELYFLTKAMVDTGVKLNIHKRNGVIADKHSIGGVSGTRASMLVVPIMVSLGYAMPKTSSRAITTPAGTADTMEVLAPVSLNPKKVEEVVNSVGGCVVWGGHLGIAPADDIIIHVEEELGMENYDKILTSILAKKVAVGSTHMILDIPYGATMKIKNAEKAHEFGNKFAQVAKKFGISVFPDVAHTLQPAGDGIGPILEAIDVLKVLERSPDRAVALEDRAIRLVLKLLELINPGASHLDYRKKIYELLDNGTVHATFLAIVKAQGGDHTVTSRSLKPAKYSVTIPSPKKGMVHAINNYNINAICRILGAPLIQGAGIVMHRKIRDLVSTREALCTLYAPSEHALKEAQETLVPFPIYDIA